MIARPICTFWVAFLLRVLCIKSCFRLRYKEKFLPKFWFTWVLEMNQSTSVSDKRVAVAVSKDKNGIDQVLLQTSRGASARVNLFSSDILHLLLQVFQN